MVVASFHCDKIRKTGTLTVTFINRYHTYNSILIIIPIIKNISWFCEILNCPITNIYYTNSMYPRKWGRCRRIVFWWEKISMLDSPTRSSFSSYAICKSDRNTKYTTFRPITSLKKDTKKNSSERPLDLTRYIISVLCATLVVIFHTFKALQLVCFGMWKKLYDTIHCKTLVSFPPIDTNLVSSCKKFTAVTWLLWPP